jgi:hypothetical protein
MTIPHGLRRSQRKKQSQICRNALMPLGYLEQLQKSSTMVCKLTLYKLITKYILPAPSTLAILRMPSSAKHDSYHNKRAFQDAVHTGKEKEVPAGLQWNGNLNKAFSILHQFLTHQWMFLSSTIGI